MCNQRGRVDSHRQHLPVAPVTVAIHAAESGYLTAVDAFQAGNAIIELGGGRRELGDTLDLAVGLSDVAAVGERVDDERPLAVVHASSEDAVAAARGLLLEACTVAAEPPAAPSTWGHSPETSRSKSKPSSRSATDFN